MATLLAMLVYFSGQIFSFSALIPSCQSGQLLTYAAGSTTPLSTYADYQCTIANPTTIALNSLGKIPCQIWVKPGYAYKLVLKDSSGTQVCSFDNVVPSSTHPYVNVREFGAQGDGTTDDTDAVLTALSFAKATNIRTLYFPTGTYKVLKAIQLDNGITVFGDGRYSCISRTDLGGEILKVGNYPNPPIDQTIYAVFFVKGDCNFIKNLSIGGVAGLTTGTVTGILFGDLSSKGAVENVEIVNMLYAIHEINGVFLYQFNNVRAVDCGYGFIFDTAHNKTSLTFNQCYALHTGPAYKMNQVHYSVMNSCAADHCNKGWWAGGFGTPDDSLGVYTFINCQMVLNSIGAEDCLGNGVVYTEQSNLTINNLTAYGCQSAFVPPSGYAVGPIQCGGLPNTVTINSYFVDSWTDIYTTNVAGLVAFNFAGTNPGIQVFIPTPTASSSNLVKGNQQTIPLYVRLEQ